ncbi:MAG TPA: beta-aspartyl-peptidase [Synergistaceae bacterium]|nr:beta-aspartyl-peptidase [Synergistaceae bacterium]
MTVLIRGGEIFSPEPLGRMDLFSLHSRIAATASEMDAGEVAKLFPSLRVLSAEGCYVLPGFIDQHVHFNGGGGEGGPRYRTPPLELGSFLRGGVTSAVGLLGTDGIARSLEELLLKARGLEEEGISTWILSGSYEIPSPTLTGSVPRDLMLIDKVLGVKIALSDHRADYPSFSQLARLCSETKRGALLAGKAGIITVHLGSGKRGLRDLLEIVEKTEIPITQFVPTHLSRTPELLEEALEFGKRGGYVDITTGSPEEGLAESAGAVAKLYREGVPLERITLSSDGNGSLPKFDASGKMTEIGIGSVSGIYHNLVHLVRHHGFDLEKAARLSSTNVAEHLELSRKGRIEKGMDADLVVLDAKTLEIRHVLAKGEIMMEEGKLLKKGTFEEDR